jgi:hypothetical protein
VWRGKRLNKRMVAMITEAEKLAKMTFTISQGSYNKGGVAASAGTHDGGGAVDVSAASLNGAQRAAVVLAMRKIGFAAWLRDPTQGNWPWHIHCEAIGDDDLSAGAAFQVAEYKRGRNGLANRGKDDGPAGYRGMTWELYLKNKAKPAPAGQTSAGTGKKDITISLGALAYARHHDAMNGIWGYDRAQVFAWAQHPKIAAITRAQFDAYYKGGLTAAKFIDMTKKVQRKFGLTQDGVFGPVTAAVMKRSGYTIIA